jgi:dihydroneopterin triphosphate diphosphatase
MKVIVEVWVYKQTDDGYRFLVLKRTKDNGGFWQPVVGKVATNEMPVAGACRELREEIGLTDTKHISKKIYDFTIDKHYITGEKIEPQVEHCYAIEVPSNTIIDITHNPCAEHDTYLWVTFEEALNLLKWKDNKDSLKATIKELKL